jgi:hypothetical protein
MAQTSRHPALRIDIPTLEPDAVMVARLASASAASKAPVGASWLVGLRAALVALVVASLGATTWAAGALAGVDTPFRHHVTQHAPLVPITPTGSTGSPQSGDSSSGGPTSPGLPDASGTHGRSHHRAAHHRGQARGHARPNNRHRRTVVGPGPVTGATWPGRGRGHHFGWGKNHGRHWGHYYAGGLDQHRLF